MLKRCSFLKIRNFCKRLMEGEGIQMAAQPQINSVQSSNVLIPAQLISTDLKFSKSERELLRQLAGEVVSLAARPMEDEKRDLWRRHNRLVPTRPVIFCDPENSWNEIIPPNQLVCEAIVARDWEKRLRKEIFWGKQMGDDYTIEPYFDIPYIHSEIDLGLKEKRIGGEDGNAYCWEAPIKTVTDIKKLHFPIIKVDFEATERLAELAEEIFGDLLTVRVKTLWWWSFGMTWTLVNLRGLDQIMYDMIDNPEIIHQIMSILSNGLQAMLTCLEEKSLLSLNSNGTYVGSGGLGWSDELPKPDFDGRVRACDMWGFAESQETVGISQDMFAEFIFRYQLPILERFGLNCYGCCEPVDTRWDVVKQIPNLRRVSISPWSNRSKMAELLGNQYIFSMKPNPTDLAMETFDAERIRVKLREEFRIARDCIVEVIMKDNHTIRNDPNRVIQWVKIAREEAENL